MVRITPDDALYAFMPCSFVAVNCALGAKTRSDLIELPDGLRVSDGYLSLAGMNRYARAHLSVRKRTDYKRGQRPRLKDLHLAGRAIVVVSGHCIYVDGETYWSYFDNEDDEVVAVWELKNADDPREP